MRCTKDWTVDEGDRGVDVVMRVVCLDLYTDDGLPLFGSIYFKVTLLTIS